MCALLVLSVLVSSAWAQDENVVQSDKNFGLGVMVQNQSFELLSFASTGTSPFFSFAHTSVTPQFLLSFRVNPKVFIEPSIGFHQSKDQWTDTGITPNLT